MLFGCLADGMYFEADVVSFNDGSGHGQARTPLGQVVGLNGDVDPLQSEVFRLTERALVKRDRRIAANPDVLGDVLSAAIDPAPNGDRYRVGREPICPNGHDPDTYVFVGRPVDPHMIFDRLMDLAEHDAWDALSATQKVQQVERVVDESLALEKERKERADLRYRRYREMRAQGAFVRTLRL